MKRVLLLVLALLLFSSRTTAQGIRNFTDDDFKKVLGKDSQFRSAHRRIRASVTTLAVATAEMIAFLVSDEARLITANRIHLR